MQSLLGAASVARQASDQYSGASRLEYRWCETAPWPFFAVSPAPDGGYGYSGLLYSATDSAFYGTLSGVGALNGGALYRTSSLGWKYLFQFGY